MGRFPVHYALGVASGVREEALNQSQGTAGVADVCLRNVVKIFGETVAVDDITLDVHHGEFFSLLGPSGCGKTTTLQMIGGFESPTEGQILLGDQDVSTGPAVQARREHRLSVLRAVPAPGRLENIAFGLKRKKFSKADVEQRVTEALRLVDLPGYERRKIAQLSGGQQQRVALARALVNRPRVLLLDEPLGALDLKLRKAMQTELKRIQQDVGITFIYVTHDQEEAMVMSDRLAVMNKGRIEQLGTPSEVYENPGTAFVAGFLGASNLLSGNVKAPGGPGAPAEILLAGGDLIGVPADRLQGSASDVQVGVRPEKLTIQASSAAVPQGCNSLAGAGARADRPSAPPRPDREPPHPAEIPARRWPRRGRACDGRAALSVRNQGNRGRGWRAGLRLDRLVVTPEAARRPELRQLAALHRHRPRQASFARAVHGGDRDQGQLLRGDPGQRSVLRTDLSRRSRPASRSATTSS